MADEDLILELKRMAQEERTTFAEVVREALREYVAARRIPRRRISCAGIARTGRGDLASRAEELLEADIDREAGW